LLVLIVVVGVGVSMMLDLVEMIIMKTAWPALEQTWHATTPGPAAPEVTGGVKIEPPSGCGKPSSTSRICAILHSVR
jgi:hypothetical protein